MTLRHTIPLGTHVSFGVYGDSYGYIVNGYQTLLGPCPPDCPHDHDCYTEPYICVRREIMSAMPLSKLETVFPTGERYGRTPTLVELTPLEEKR